MNQNISPQVFCSEENLEETILTLYRNYEIDVVEHLPDFCSFIILDSSRNISIAQKGAFSPAPVYYYYNEQRLYVSFKIKELIGYVDHPKPNIRKIRGYLSFENEIGRTDNLTFYQDIYRLLPGEALICRNSGNPIFKTTPIISIEKPPKDKEEHLTSIQERFSTSVSKHISKHKRVAANLSGGLDSSAVNCIAQRFHSDKIASLYVDTSTIEADEYLFAQAVSSKIDSNLLKLDSSDYNLAIAIKRCIEITGLPETNNLPSPFYRAIIDTCVKNNASILLSGFLGDQIIDYGFRYYDELATQNKWEKLKQTLELHGYSPKQVRQVILKLVVKHSNTRINLRGLIKADTILHSRLQFNRTDTIFGNKKILKKFIRKKLSSNNNKLTGLFREKSWIESKTDRKELDLNKLVKGQLTPDHHEILQGVYQHIVVEALEQHYLLFTNENIEVAYPFFDRGLLEVTLQSTNEWKFSDGKARSTLREALKDILPQEIYTRTSKANFNNYTLAMFFELHQLFKTNCGDNYNSHPVWQIVDRRMFDKMVSRLNSETLRERHLTATVFLANRVIYLAFWLDSCIEARKGTELI